MQRHCMYYHHYVYYSIMVNAPFIGIWALSSSSLLRILTIKLQKIIPWCLLKSSNYSLLCLPAHFILNSSHESISNKHKMDTSTISNSRVGICVLDVSLHLRSKNYSLIVFPALARLWAVSLQSLFKWLYLYSSYVRLHYPVNLKFIPNLR